MRAVQIKSIIMKTGQIVYPELRSSVRSGYFLPAILVLILYNTSLYAQKQYLARSLSFITEVTASNSTPSAHYSPIFGVGDDSSAIITGVRRYGCLIIDPLGRSNGERFSDEEQVFYILDGTGIFNYGKESLPVGRNDFIYLPAGIKSNFENPRERPLSVIAMSFKIQPGNKIKPADRMMIANADEVPFQVLGSHGTTTQFQLLMGTTESTRDKLAAACQISSLFVMDFAPGGTNIPHRHEDEEEIYFVLRGQGDMVAGETSDKKELRHPAKKGDAYFFSPDTLIGFYSGNAEGEEHSRILAVRFTYPLKPAKP